MEINTRKEEYSKKVGIGEFKVLRFNPTRQELNKLLGREDSDTDDELTYTGTSEERHRTIRLSIWCEEVRTGYKTPVTLFLEEMDVISQNGKYQYINAVGSSTYVDKESNLPDWFKKAQSYRAAKKGENELMEFLRSWLVGIELNLEKGGARNNILLDMSKIFSGDVRELNDLVSSEFAGTITLMTVVRARDVQEQGETKTKLYQSVFTKAFLPGNCARYFRTGASGQKPKFVERFVEKVIDREYGCKDFYAMEEIRDYKEGENPVASPQAKLTEQGNDY